MDIEKGNYIKNGGYTKTTPRKWTEKEIEYMKSLIDNGMSYKDIANILDRSEVSVSIKAKRMGKNKIHIMQNMLKKNMKQIINF